MKIYTRKGDDGTTGLIGGTRVSKAHLRIESYGTVDELNSWIGMVRDALPEDSAHVEYLQSVQNILFTIGSHLAFDPDKARMTLPEIPKGCVGSLEEQIDKMNETLPEMRNFILPGGHPVASQAHVARCVCRRAERKVTALVEIATIEALILEYLNRLSDYLFVLSRDITHKHNGTEIAWIPEK